MFCSSLLPGSQTYLTAQIIQWHFFLCKQICALATLTPWSWFCLDPEGVYFFKASLWIFEALMIGLPQTALPAVPSPDRGWTLRKERKGKVQALERPLWVNLPPRTSFIDTEQDGPQTGRRTEEGEASEQKEPGALYNMRKPWWGPETSGDEPLPAGCMALSPQNPERFQGLSFEWSL